MDKSELQEKIRLKQRALSKIQEIEATVLAFSNDIALRVSKHIGTDCVVDSEYYFNEFTGVIKTNEIFLLFNIKLNSDIIIKNLEATDAHIMHSYKFTECIADKLKTISFTNNPFLVIVVKDILYLTALVSLEELFKENGKPTLRMSPDYDLCEYKYDDKGNLLSHKISNGYWEEYTYDDKGNKLSYKNSNDQWYNWTYDDKGNKLSYRSFKGEWAGWIYDDNARLIKYVDFAGNSKEYNYDNITD